MHTVYTLKTGPLFIAKGESTTYRVFLTSLLLQLSCYSVWVMRCYTNKSSQHTNRWFQCVCVYVCVYRRLCVLCSSSKKTRWGYLLQLPGTLICFLILFFIREKSTEHVCHFWARPCFIFKEPHRHQIHAREHTLGNSSSRSHQVTPACTHTPCGAHAQDTHLSEQINSMAKKQTHTRISSPSSSSVEVVPAARRQTNTVLCVKN